ncbi:MAG: transporter [Solirubrobacteraceae bacterium]|nr:transporter [Solirubrobacteraceae bacterium]
MIAVLAAMAASTAAGLAIHGRSAELGRRVATLALTTLLWVVSPFVIVFSLPHLHVDARLAGALLLAYAVAAVVGFVAWIVGSRVLRLPRACTGTLICAAIVMNTGYFGLPFVSALLGRSHLTDAVAFDSLVSGPLFYVAGFAVGAAFGATSPDVSRRARTRQLVLRNPPLVAAVVGLLLPASAAPGALVSVAHHAVWVLLVLGFVALGVTLAAEAHEGAVAFPPRVDAQIGAALLLRLVLAPALYFGLTTLLGGAPTAFRVDEAMPVGINMLVVAHAARLDLRVASSAIAWSTIVVATWGVVASLA